MTQMTQTVQGLPARRLQEQKQIALQHALQVLASGPGLERPDTPDGVVTAVRRLPAVEAELRAVSCGHRCPATGCARVARHPQPVRPSGRGHRPRGCRTQRRRHDADSVGQDALLQPAGPRQHPQEAGDARAVSVSDQGAGAGSDGRAARAGRGDWGGRQATRLACTPTTATRRPMRGGRFARARTSS